MLKVQYDYQVFSQQKYGGISRYFYELITNLNKIQDISCSTSILLSDNHYTSSSNQIKHYQFPKFINFNKKAEIQNYLNQLYSIQKIKRSGFDIFHPTNYNPYFLNHIGNLPFVVTVYDMIHEKFPNFFSKNDLTTERKKRLVKKSNRIIAISENTKRDLINIFDVNPDKIDVVYLGNSLQKPTNSVKPESLPSNYILFVGNRGSYKNFMNFFHAAKRLLKEDRNLNIVCVGQRPFNKLELIEFKKSNVQNQLHHYAASDINLPLFYMNARLFVFPSLYEGFGIPILESFANQCPIACSNTSSLPEVAGDAAIYFDPYNIDSIHESISKPLKDDLLRSQLIEKGTLRLELFSWEKTAIKTKEIYENCINNRG